MIPAPLRFPSFRALASTVALLAAHSFASGAEFSVTPIRAELKAGALTETITVTNHSQASLRLSVKLMEWTQGPAGDDVYTESSDLVYFPRQLDIEPDGKRLIRVGAKAPASGSERTYRLFIEEQPEAAADQTRAQVAFYFRFAVPVFLTPAAPKPAPEVMQPVLSGGKAAIQVRNEGNQHVRLNKVVFSTDAGFTQEVAGWYSLARSSRSYSADIPRDTCRKSKVLNVVLEGEGLRFDRTLNVDPAACG